MKIYLAIGSANKYRVELFKKCNAERVLISYATILGRADIRIPFSDVMLDSGAYSLETGKENVDNIISQFVKVGMKKNDTELYLKSRKLARSKEYLKSYILWLQLYLDKYPQIKAYVNLDDLSDPFVTVKNQLIMESEGLNPLPVYHYGEPTNILDEMCSEYEYVGLGGIAVGTIDPKRLQVFWEWIYDRYSDNKFHLFGIGTVSPFFYYQPYSIDSTSWNVGSRFGDLMCYAKGLPYRFAAREMYGYKFFFNLEELFSNNIRAQIDWEKCEWLKNVPKKGGEQKRLI